MYRLLVVVLLALALTGCVRNTARGQAKAFANSIIGQPVASVLTPEVRHPDLGTWRGRTDHPDGQTDYKYSYSLLLQRVDQDFSVERDAHGNVVAINVGYIVIHIDADGIVTGYSIVKD